MTRRTDSNVVAEQWLHATIPSHRKAIPKRELGAWNPNVKTERAMPHHGGSLVITSECNHGRIETSTIGINANHGFRCQPKQGAKRHLKPSDSDKVRHKGGSAATEVGCSMHAFGNFHNSLLNSTFSAPIPSSTHTQGSLVHSQFGQSCQLSEIPRNGSCDVCIGHLPGSGTSSERWQEEEKKTSWRTIMPAQEKRWTE